MGASDHTKTCGCQVSGDHAENQVRETFLTPMPRDPAMVSDRQGEESVPSLSDFKILLVHVVVHACMHPSIQTAAMKSYHVPGSGLSAQTQKRRNRQKPRFKELTP